METNRVITGDMFDVVDDLPDNSVHAVVTDPPYGLAFMGKSWDDFDPKEYQEFSEEWARAVDRVLRPGGHLLAFSGSRTHHRAFTGIEDAGYTLRDTITWHYGSGFPKGTALDKQIDKRNDAIDDRETVDQQHGNGIEPGHGNFVNNQNADWNEDGFEVTEPATDAAKRWEGFSTQLKPATEFVALARSELSEDTIVDNVLEWGAGALNIDGCRIGTEENLRAGSNKRDEANVIGERHDPNAFDRDDYEYEQAEDGRYPANVAFDKSEAERLDGRNDKSEANVRRGEDGGFGRGNVYGNDDHNGLDPERGFDDSGGPSRYFYTSKASKSERTQDGTIDNPHPTVKPVDLMEWLVKLVTREEHVVLDPFAGSGTTLMACKNTGRQFVGIERDELYADIARQRVGIGAREPDRVIDTADGQVSIADFG